MSFDFRQFTLEEARSLLQQLRNELSRLVELKNILGSKNYDIYRHQYFGGSGPNGKRHYPLHRISTSRQRPHRVEDP